MFLIQFNTKDTYLLSYMLGQSMIT